MRKLVVLILCLFFIGVIIQPGFSQSADQAEDCCRKADCEKKDGECCQVKQVAEIKQIDPFFYTAIEKTGSYEQHADVFQLLYMEAGKQELPMDAMPFGIYYNSPQDTPEDQLKWEIGFPLTEKKEVAAPLTVKKWEFTTLASHVYDGPFDDGLGKAYQAVVEWIGKNGYVPAGPVMEKYLSMPVTDDKGVMSGKIEILFPVQKTAQ